MGFLTVPQPYFLIQFANLKKTQESLFLCQRNALLPNDVSGYGLPHREYPYGNVTFTNTTDEIIYGAYVVCAIMDRNDNVVYVDRDRYNNLGVHPGSTVTLKMYIDSDYIDYLEVNTINLAKVD